MGGVVGPLIVYVLQIPILIGCVTGLIPVHPIVIVLPLVVFLNARVEGRGVEGLGLAVWPTGRAVSLVLIFALLGLGQRLIVLRLEGIPLQYFPLTEAWVGSLVRDFAVDIFVIAFWEEIVNRGYVQTRLQEALGFWGVLVATLLFASLHLPSALHDYGWTSAALFRFVQVLVGGLLLGVVYWWTGSVLVTVALHGLRNFLALSLIVRLSGVAAAEIQASQVGFQLAWLLGETGLAVLVSRMLYGGSRTAALEPERSLVRS
ncbi:MAG: CPBP family intramembrane metalloprotease [Anaerolineae bacterium]|jgi:membrane protease YdiL (CAAX protease family)